MPNKFCPQPYPSNKASERPHNQPSSLRLSLPLNSALDCRLASSRCFRSLRIRSSSEQILRCWSVIISCGVQYSASYPFGFSMFSFPPCWALLTSPPALGGRDLPNPRWGTYIHRRRWFRRKRYKFRSATISLSVAALRFRCEFLRIPVHPDTLACTPQECNRVILYARIVVLPEFVCSYFSPICPNKHVEAIRYDLLAHHPSCISSSSFTATDSKLFSGIR